MSVRPKKPVLVGECEQSRCVGAGVPLVSALVVPSDAILPLGKSEIPGLRDDGLMGKISASDPFNLVSAPSVLTSEAVAAAVGCPQTAPVISSGALFDSQVESKVVVDQNHLTTVIAIQSLMVQFSHPQ